MERPGYCLTSCIFSYSSCKWPYFYSFQLVRFSLKIFIKGRGFYSCCYFNLGFFSLDNLNHRLHFSPLVISLQKSQLPSFLLILFYILSKDSVIVLLNKQCLHLCFFFIWINGCLYPPTNSVGPKVYLCFKFYNQVLINFWHSINLLKIIVEGRIYNAVCKVLASYIANLSLPLPQNIGSLALKARSKLWSEQHTM